MSALSEFSIESEKGKGRSFRALHFASVTANNLWPGGSTGKDITRPVYASFLGSEEELRPFAANLSCGRKAVGSTKRRSNGGFEFLKSAGYKQFWQREPEGSILSVFLPELFLLDGSGMVDPKDVKFVLLPSKAWVLSQRGIDVQACVDHVKRLPFIQALNAPPVKDRWGNLAEHDPPLSDEKLAELSVIAYLFAAYLDRRTRAPIPTSGKLYLQIMLACLKEGLATWATEARGGWYAGSKFGHHGSFGFDEEGTQEAGFLPGIAFKSDHETVEALLASEISTYYEMEG